MLLSAITQIFLFPNYVCWRDSYVCWRDQRQRSVGTGDDVDSDENYRHAAFTREGVPRLPSYTSRPYGEYTRERVAEFPDQHMLQNDNSEQKIMSSTQSESSICHRDSTFKSGHVYECPQFTTVTPPWMLAMFTSATCIIATAHLSIDILTSAHSLTWLLHLEIS